MTRRFNRTTGCAAGPSCRGLPVLIGALLTLWAGAADRDAFLMVSDASDQQRRLEELVHDVVRLPEAVVHQRGIPRAGLDQERRRPRDAHRLGAVAAQARADVDDTRARP